MTPGIDPWNQSPPVMGPSSGTLPGLAPEGRWRRKTLLWSPTELTAQMKWLMSVFMIVGLNHISLGLNHISLGLATSAWSRRRELRNFNPHHGLQVMDSNNAADLLTSPLKRVLLNKHVIWGRRLCRQSGGSLGVMVGHIKIEELSHEINFGTLSQTYNNQ